MSHPGRMTSRFRQATTPLTGDETVDLIQGGKNRRTSLNNFLARAFARANHTGTQEIATVDGLEDALAGKAPSTGIAQSAVTGLPASLTALATADTTEAAARAAADATLTTALAGKQATIPSGTFAELIALAGSPDLLIAGTITRDANDAATSAPVVWPNGQPGTYTATSVSTAFPGAVDAYTITYGSPVTRTYTQAAVTRNANGAVTVRPAITVA